MIRPVVPGIDRTHRYRARGYRDVAVIPDYLADGDGKVSFIKRPHWIAGGRPCGDGVEGAIPLTGSGRRGIRPRIVGLG